MEKITQFPGNYTYLERLCPTNKEYREDAKQVKERIHCPNMCCIDILIILSPRHLKNSKCRERLSQNSLSASRQTLQKRPAVTNQFPESHQPGKFDSSQERRLALDTTLRHTLSQTIVPPINMFY